MENKKYGNYVGFKGWFGGGGSWGIDRYLYTIHRITGFIIMIFLIIHIFESGTRILGMETWTSNMALLHHLIFKIGEFIIILCVAFHAMNGIRLIVIELGWGVGKAREPVFPYRSSLNTQRPLMVVMTVIGILLMIAGGYDLFFLGI